MTRASRPASVGVETINEFGEHQTTMIAGEHPLTLYLDKRELVTLMTLGAEPEFLTLGYLRNQGFVDSPEQLASIQVDWGSESVAITSKRLADSGQTLWDEAGNSIAQKMEHRTVTTGCGQGTVFGNMMEQFATITLPAHFRFSQQQLLDMLDQVRRHESVYKVAGAVHGCALFALDNHDQSSALPELLSFVEDVGRHNAVDAIAGWMWLHPEHAQRPLVFYTTGRLTSEMVIKAGQMGIAVLVSRSGLTHMGFSLAEKLGMTLIGRCQGRHFLIFTGAQRFHAQPELAAFQGPSKAGSGGQSGE